MSQATKAEQFAALHVQGRPLILVNIWDAGSATAIAEGGSSAIATGSWSMAAAQGYQDGEAIPLSLVERVVGQICESVDLPVTVDIEGGYAAAPEKVAANVERIVSAGAVGINLEDGVVGTDDLYDVATQCRRIEAVRAMAERCGVSLFINARTDLFLRAAASQDHPALLASAIERAQAYRDAGASGFFAPGLADTVLIASLCDAVRLPVNIMMADGGPTVSRLTEIGVHRISYGPKPFIDCMQYLREQVRRRST